MVWIARIGSLVSLGFVLLFVIAELLNSNVARPTTSEWIGLSLWPAGVCLGLVIACSEQDWEAVLPQSASSVFTFGVC
jgi:hypothetical protein